MEQPQSEFAILWERMRAGSEEAARELVASYGHHIRKVVRRLLPDQLRRHFDSQDFTQAVLASFLRAGPGTPFDDDEALLRYLTAVARNKVADACRQFFGTQRADLHRERRLADGEAGPADPAPAPDREAAARDEWEQLLRRKRPRDRLILRMLAEGWTQAEVARNRGISERTVRAVLAKVRREWREREEG